MDIKDVSGNRSGESEFGRRFWKAIAYTECKVFGQEFAARVGCDRHSNRWWFQLVYDADGQEWRGRKWFLSKHMTDDEIIKTIWLAFEIAVRHELMEGFKVNGFRVFNPHTPFSTLILGSTKEEFRNPPKVIPAGVEYLNTVF